MNKNNRQYEYVIGIDLGHGETSAAICSIDWDATSDQLEGAKDLEMGGNKKVIPSAITILDNGNAYIGESAFNPEILKKAKVRVCFKQAPRDINGEAEQLMMRFMTEVYKRIRENNSGLLTDTNHLVYIATPSGWDKKTQQLYVQMARKAGLPTPPDGVTKESRAAFVKAQHDSTSGIGRNIDKGAIVFDMGSSTLDFTYMNKDLPNLIDNGYDCGASRVEKAIFAQNEKDSEAVQLFEKKYPALKDYLLFKAREVKEQVYFDPTLKVKKTINFDDIIDDEELEDERYKLAFQPGELDEFLRKIGYLREIEEAMLDYKRNYIPNQQIYGVFLTGGASRMDFIKELVSSCWGVPVEQIYRDSDPSLTISEGVAEVARMDLRTESLDTSLEEDITALQNSTVVYDTFVEKFGYNLWDKVTDSVIGVITYFRDSDTDYSINDLQAGIENAVEETIKEESAEASAYMEAAVSESLQGIQQKVEDIIKHYSQQGMNVKNATYDVSVPKISDINLDGVMQEITDKIAAESSDWGGAIAGAAIGGAVAMLLGGPLMWLVGGAAFLGSLFFGDSEEEKKAKAMSRDLNKEDRAKVFASLQEKWDDISRSIERSIRSAVGGDQKIKYAINDATKQLLKSYKENLKSARILID